jgi:asparagine synthase (glutamine-hydrolysing)
MGFSIPLEDIFKSNTFKSKWESEILPGIISRNIFNVDYVKSLMTKNETFSSEDLSAIWTMTTFEIWAKQYLD